MAQSTDGFSLVEVLCAFAVLALISLSFIRVVEYTSVAQRAVIARLQARETVERAVVNIGGESTSYQPGYEVRSVHVNDGTRWAIITKKSKEPLHVWKFIISKPIRDEQPDLRWHSR